MAGGNPTKMAQYDVKKRELEQIKAKHFNEEHPFVDGFNESYLSELKSYAEANPDDESAQVRYALQKERFTVREASKNAHIDIRVAKSNLLQKVQEGNVTEADVKAAWTFAKKNSSVENRVLYSKIKRMVESAEQAE
ncbi:hypothetical protein BAOM_4595 [Peribacillus asahii]|uniref:Uncharacterized protein n=2 Tax=Peribacillus asahii TaxID=228899 RepID=A0A3T0KXX6_9BACI|nr:hypothetical protein BAOM_4595 [Peribacillus asahii]